MLPPPTRVGIPCCAASNRMLRWPPPPASLPGFGGGRSIKTTRGKSLEAQYLASPPIPFVAANKAGFYYSGPGAGRDSQQQSAPVQAVEEEQHTGAKRRHRQTNSLFQRRNHFCGKAPAASRPDEAIQGTAARAKPPAGAGAQPQICTIPGPGTPTARPHGGLQAGSKPAARNTAVRVSPGWHHTRHAVASSDAGGARTVSRCTPPPVSHARSPQGRLSASFSRKKRPQAPIFEALGPQGRPAAAPPG